MKNHMTNHNIHMTEQDNDECRTSSCMPADQRRLRARTCNSCCLLTSHACAHFWQNFKNQRRTRQRSSRYNAVARSGSRVSAARGETPDAAAPLAYWISNTLLSFTTRRQSSLVRSSLKLSFSRLIDLRVMTLYRSSCARTTPSPGTQRLCRGGWRSTSHHQVYISRCSGVGGMETLHPSWPGESRAYDFDDAARCSATERLGRMQMLGCYAIKLGDCSDGVQAGH